MQTEPLIYIQNPPAKSELAELINNPPVEIWQANYKVILWLDSMKREVKKLK